MGIVNLPFTLTNGTVADADEVQGNDNALRDGVNNIETANIANKNVTEAKLADNINPVFRTEEIGVRNFIVDGNNWITATTSGDLNYTFNAMTCYVDGNRLEIASFTQLYTALRDTYVDVDTTGAVTFGEVLNGGVAPAQLPGTLRLAKVIADVSTVTDVQLLAAGSAFSSVAEIRYKYVEANAIRDTTPPSSPGSQFIFIQFRGFDNTGVYEMDTGEAGVTIDLGNKGVPNGYDLVANPTLNSVLHVYVIAAADGSQPLAGLATQEVTFADQGPFAGTFPPGYNIAKWVGAVFTEPEGYTLPSIQNGNTTTFWGGFIRNVFLASDNGMWVHKDLSPYMPITNAREVLVFTEVDGAGGGARSTGLGSLGATGSGRPHDTPGTIIAVEGLQVSISASPFTLEYHQRSQVWYPTDRNGTLPYYSNNVKDGTGSGGQGDLSGGPDGIALAGWRYFHD